MSAEAPRTTRIPPLEGLLDTAPCGFLSFGDDGCVEGINANLLDMLGFERGDVIGRHVENILTTGSRIFYQTHWFPLLRLRGGAEEIFLMLRARSGEEVGVLVNAVRREADGRAAYDCILMRVRERQKYEGELLRARKAAEEAHAELAQHTRELQAANGLLESQTLELEAQQEQLRAQASELEAVGEELRMMNEELVVRTEEAERSRAAAEQANHAKSAFLAVMSHELRTPLNAIAGYSELLDMGIHGPVTAAQHEALDRITRAQRHLLRLINDVLNLSRIEAGHVDYRVEDVAAARIIDEVVPMVEPQLAERGLSLERSVGPDLVVRADREKLQQILLNLLSNAIKFTPAGGRVDIRAVRREDAPQLVFLAVSDTGIGIPQDKLDRVFEPFVQVDVSHAARKQGTGLGLAISRDLARGMGGDLRARSVPGQGSTFTLTLQYAGAAAGAPTD